MEIIFAIALIAGMVVVLYASQGPHCPKHKFTRMNVISRKPTYDTFMTGAAEIKKQEVEYRCPVCGEMLIREEIAN